MKTWRSWWLAWLLVPGAGGAEAPQLIPFQGRLTDQQGQVYADGQFSVLFQIYAEPVGGTALWDERHEKVGVINGMLNVFLGSIEPLTGVDFSQTRHLGITIDADNNPNTPDPEMLPRQMIIPAFWARHSDRSSDSVKLAGHDWSSILSQGNNPQASTIAEQRLPSGVTVPVGGVIMWWGSVADIPSGFELCDGGPPTTAGALLGGSKPDLRDRFVKGATQEKSDVKSEPRQGGAHEIALRSTGGTALTVAQMPAHNHSGTTGPANAMEYGLFSGTPIFRNPNENVRTVWNGIGNGAGVGRNDDNFQGSAHTHNFTTSTVGGNQPHNHSIPAHDNRPAFLEMLYIIRVM